MREGASIGCSDSKIWAVGARHDRSQPLAIALRFLVPHSEIRRSTEMASGSRQPSFTTDAQSW